jgi:hypothetical protein
LLRNLSVSFRVHFKEYFLNGAPLGSAGSANKSGWMTDKDFLLFMKHFIQHVRPSKENEVVLFLDNHSSHLSIEVLILLKSYPFIISYLPCIVNISTKNIHLNRNVIYLFIRLTDIPSLELLVHKNNMGYHAPIDGAKCPFNGASCLLIFMFSHLLFGLIKGSFCKLKIRGT